MLSGNTDNSDINSDNDHNDEYNHNYNDKAVMTAALSATMILPLMATVITMKKITTELFCV